MTDDQPATGETPAGAPWSVDTLADLHAGALDERTAMRLWPRVRADPRAAAIISALDATTQDLADLGTQAESTPPEVATRIDAALAQEAAQHSATAPEKSASVISIDTARRRRNRWLGWGAGTVATVAAVAVAIAIAGPGQSFEQGPNMAAPASETSAPAPPALALSSGNLGKAIGPVAGGRDLGPLEDEAQLDSCLAANDIDPDVKPVGVHPATIDGQRAVIVLYPTGESAQYRLIALPTDCGTNSPGLLADKIIGNGGG